MHTTHSSTHIDTMFRSQVIWPFFLCTLLLGSFKMVRDISNSLYPCLAVYSSLGVYLGECVFVAREVDCVNSGDRTLSRIGTNSDETVSVSVELFFKRNNDTLK